MKTIGAYEAKTHLPQLLRRVRKGEEFTITIHGQPVARLGPASEEISESSIRQTIEELKEFSRSYRQKVDRATLKAWKEHGRR